MLDANAPATQPPKGYKNITEQKRGFKDAHLFFWFGLVLFFKGFALMCQGSDLGTVMNLSACFRLCAASRQVAIRALPHPQLSLLSFSFFSLSNFHFREFSGLRLCHP